ncbi:hypothetical protein OGR47_05330 [Methylocystis sp. MJC1]|jgi:hypothetical protein|uniref:hypothetical protein n=1 Tax=Methylocystis sp. MJC1 TaxID=2654282 RepID=UPI0013EAF94B|nr:hypothetical protein [Methylocystis sp. MJC1]KAF2992446.1 hypothetical protein MJC1_00022 [Methylocystis sp. MJC1]MBU6526425.1 hypothetical protein [Methylocystis sp. MJC1]UZX12867.1 hypothetical protein OGR47_05330 [Methylocystis sp. MJC1]
MAAKRLIFAAAAALLVGQTIAQPAAATAIYVGPSIAVRPPPYAWRECPTCYKGHDFGRDCFQNVWNGFEQIWTNVCLLGWH